MARDSQAALVAASSRCLLAETVFPDSTPVKPMKGLVG